MGSHLIDGEFQSDKYPSCPRGKVPLSTKDRAAQPLLWQYAQGHREKDAEFSDDLEAALVGHGYVPDEAMIAVDEARAAVLVYRAECERYDLKMAAYRNLPRTDPELVTDAASYLAEQQAAARALRVWSAIGDLRSQRLRTARDALTRATTLLLAAHGLPFDLC